ncbi:MAG: amino acid adenylation domain-containing protein [Pseudomonadota bacterium]
MNSADAWKDISEALRKSASRRTHDPPPRPKTNAAEPVAIIGVSGRLPGCATVQAFWDALDRNEPLITRCDLDWMQTRLGLPEGPEGDGFFGGFMPGADTFDAGFFDVNPGDAADMDPRLRLLLMEVYHALNDAGLSPGAMAGSKTAMFVAAQDAEYDDALRPQTGGETYAQSCMLANQLSYVFDFNGPSEVIEAQCASSALALHRAVQSLRSGEADCCIVAGVTLLLRSEPFEVLQATGQLSAKGTVDSFGANASGHIRSEGAIALVLKPLCDAVRDKDPIHAVIRETAVNFNGRDGASIAAPNPKRHAEVIEDCYRRAAINPAHVGTIEAQGMGNALSDLAEWQAINRALMTLAREQGQDLKDASCAVSTLKPLIGHMEAASGLGAVLKLIHSFNSDQIFPITNFDAPHPDLDTANRPAMLAQSKTRWGSSDHPKYAAIHSYSMGGVNAHVLLEAAKKQSSALPQSGGTEVILVSARSKQSLANMLRDLLDHVKTHPIHLADLAYTLRTGRDHFEHRFATVVSTQDGLINALETALSSDGSGVEQQIYFGTTRQTRIAAPAEAMSPDAFARAWVDGAATDALDTDDQVARKIRLPGYAFDRTRHWLKEKTPVSHDVGTFVFDQVAQTLGCDREDVDGTKHIFDFGFDSLFAMRLLGRVAKTFGLSVSGRDLIDFPTLNALVAHYTTLPASQKTTALAPPQVPVAQGDLPLSIGQQGLWALQQTRPDMSALNLPLCFKFADHLSLDALRHALAHCFETFPILTSHFELGPNGPMRRENPQAQIEIDTFEYQGRLPKAEIEKQAKQPFDLAVGPPVRLSVWECEGAPSYLLIVVHHIVFDGGSFAPFCSAFFEAYHAFENGAKAPANRAPDRSFEAFVLDETAGLSASSEAKAFWLDQLQAPLPDLRLAPDFPRSAAEPFAGAHVSRRLSKQTEKALTAFARDARIPPSAVILSAFMVLVHRLTGSDDVIVGMPFHGRTDDAYTETVGYLVNMLPIRQQGLTELCFDDLARAVQLRLAEATDHASYPFGQMVKDQDTPPDPDCPPVFQIGFEYQNAFAQDAVPALQAEVGASVELLQSVVQEGEYELVLEIRPDDDGFATTLKFNPHLFDTDRIEKHLQRLDHILGQACKNPKVDVAGVDLILKDERKVLMTRSSTENDTSSTDGSLLDLIQPHVTARGDQIAVSSDGQSFTYHALQKASHAIAGQLDQLGVCEGTRVAMLLSRSADVVPAIMGVLRLGASFVPLDPDHPKSRLKHILQDCGADIILASKDHQNLATSLASPGQTVVIADPEARAIKVSHQAPAPQDTAYIIYTSGSTGQPKGVEVSHGALINLLTSLQARLGTGPHVRMLATTTFAFDISILELLLPIVAGGEVRVFGGVDTNALKADIEAYQPTMMQATPSAWVSLLAAGWVPDADITLLCGGEALPEPLRARFAKAKATVWNMYGPTETTIWSTCGPMSVEGDAIDIGTPIANTQVYILDDQQRLLPPGEPGELCIAGAGLAKGYVNQPEKTKDAFVANPFERGARLYRTGDLARWSSDGRLIHLGRKDQMIKIRGHRVEPGEIEAVLEAVSGVEQATVVARQVDQALQLIAYVTRKEVAAVNTGDVRNAVQQSLPDYMHPAHVVWIDDTPLTPAGKRDRKALSDRDLAPVDRGQRHSAASHLEDDIHRIWCRVLNVARIPRDMGFFEAGGCSVTAATAALQIADQFDVPFTPTDLFRTPTIADIARKIQPGAPQHSPIAAPPSSSPAFSTRIPTSETAPSGALAIVGMSCSLPGAPNLRAFWDNLQNGHEAREDISREALMSAGVDPDLIDDPNLIPVQFSLPDKDGFDPEFFNISAKNAAYMDPQFRHLLQQAWLAFEDAGYLPEDMPDTAVFTSTSNGHYKTALHLQGGLSREDAYAAWIHGQDGSIPTQISYRLGLTGPSLAVHTNCSSSLVSLQLAQQMLSDRQAGAALVGAASIFAVPGLGHHFLPGQNLSSDGHCRSFDAKADGLVAGEGAGMILVKRLEDAEHDGDHIYAVVQGIAVNNDGANKAGFYAPSVIGQARVIKEALAHAQIEGAQVSYCETHGTGTALGDPIEVAALSQVYGRETAAGLGSLKPNIGHLDTAAGLAGLIKTAMILKTGHIPPSINFDALNPAIDLTDSKLRIVDRKQDWREIDTADKGTRYASVSAFGIGGTNAHAIVSNHDPIPPDPDENGPQIVVLSAASPEQLHTHVTQLHAFLEDADHLRLCDIAFTLQVGRKAMAYRYACVAHSLEDLQSSLAQALKTQAGYWGHVSLDGPHMDREDSAVLLAHWNASQSLDKIAQLWASGADIAWQSLPSSGGRRVSLPTYPFKKERFWVDSLKQPTGVAETVAGEAKPAALSIFQKRSGRFTGTTGVHTGKRCVALLGRAARHAEAFADDPDLDVVSYPTTPDGADHQRFGHIARQILDLVQGVIASGQPTQLQVVADSSDAFDQGYEAFSAFLDTAQQECPSISAQFILVATEEAAKVVKTAGEQSKLTGPVLRRVTSGTCTTDAWEETPFVAQGPSPWRMGGVYVISGGTGALGLQMAEQIARSATGTRLILLSRRGREEGIVDRLTALRHLAEVEVKACDLCDFAQTQQVVEEVIKRHGALHGVLHFAGVNADAMLANTSGEAFDRVLGPKVIGAQALDKAAAGQDLDMFVLASSLASAKGSVGQGDYCLANGFLNAFAARRNAQKPGLTCSLLWPLWQDGGMFPSSRALAAMQATTGLHPMPSDLGFAALDHALRHNLEQVAVLYGDRSKAKAWLTEDPAPQSQGVTETDDLETYLSQVIAPVLGRSQDRFDPGEPLQNYGIDSLAITQIAQKLTPLVGPEAATLLYRYPTVNELAQHLRDVGVSPQKRIATAAVAPSIRSRVTQEPTDDRIAIIGMSGRYPDADTLQEFWQNLAAGRDSITEVPQDRWAIEDVYEPDQAAAVAQGKSYSKCGGFLTGFADFDPLFFNIAPKEAWDMDPQERLVLQAAWHAMEDAGITRRHLRELYQHRLGVFAGVTKTGFDLIGQAQRDQGKVAFPHTSFGSIANRVSYILDAHGPSMPIDTMCSSGLTAIHQACKALLSGECDLALATAVNLYLHPSNYSGLSSAYMLSPTGRCHSFGSAADGYVPGEGVGAFLLKPLADAKRDEDPIHAVILASQVNHGGRTNGYTVPSPKAQASLIRAGLAQAGLSANDIGVVEAHGTGTALGDPIEVAALKEAFEPDQPDPQSIALSSVKSNCGHAEAAAGLAGLSKAVLQIQARQIAPSLHSAQTNGGIDFAKSPFHVPQRLLDWPSKEGTPRRATVSSFGAGGANAFVVVEEADPPEMATAEDQDRILIFPVSARNWDGLRRVAQALHDHVQRGSDRLCDIAFTLQQGREALQSRAAVIASTREALLRGLDALSKDISASAEVLGEEDAAVEALARAWTAGSDIAWPDMAAEARPRRIRLPLYPFERQRFWFEPASMSEQSDASHIVLKPVWLLGEQAADDVSDRPLTVIDANADQKRLILSEYPNALFETAQTIMQSAPPEAAHLVWFANGDDPAKALLHLAQSLMRHGCQGRSLGLTVITRGAFATDMGAAAVHGLAGSLAQEVPLWDIRALDLGASDALHLAKALRVRGQAGQVSFLYQAGAWHTRCLVPGVWEVPKTATYAEGGVYVVIGGAGGLGQAWTRHVLAQTDAKIIWLGRSSPNGDVAQARERFGQAVDYVKTDARDKASLQKSLARIHQDYGRIDGVIVSALAGYDCAVADLTDSVFDDVMATRVQVVQNLSECLRDKRPGFVVAFSSMASFARPAGMPAYAAGCAAADAAMSDLGHALRCQATVINWGYWDIGGGARVTQAMKALVEKRGVVPMDPTQAFAAMDWAISAGMPQVAITRTTRPDAIEAFRGDITWTGLSAQRLPPLPAISPSQKAPPALSLAEELDAWLARLTHAALFEAGFIDAQSQTDAPDQHGMLSKYRPWWDEAMHILCAQGWMARRGDGSLRVARAPSSDVWQAWQDAQQKFRNEPATRVLAVLASDCLRHLGAILRGETLVTDILFPDGKMDKIEGLYSNNAICDFFNSVLADGVDAVVRQRIEQDPEARLRILEIGAGTGGSTSILLPRLASVSSSIAEYRYTDLSRSFFDHARTRFGRVPFLEFSLLDIEQSIAPQGLMPGRYDVVFGTNVLHATRDIRNTLRNAKSLLRPGGLLMVNDISDKSVPASLLFGLIDGWALAEDRHLRIEGSPGLFPDTWQQVMEMEGFTNVQRPAQDHHNLGQLILLGQSDGVVFGRAVPEPRTTPEAESSHPSEHAATDEDAQNGDAKGALEMGELEDVIEEALADALVIDRADIANDMPFSDYGLDSILGVGFITALERQFRLKLNTTLLFDHSTVAQLAAYLGSEHADDIQLPKAHRARSLAMNEASATTSSAPTEGIAIIGMSGQFPGARSVDAFWQNMITGVDPVSELPSSYLSPDSVSDTPAPGKSYCKWGGILQSRSEFDPLFFNLAPRDAPSMNPHQRLILQEAWRALENAGINPRDCAGTQTGIFVGCEPSGYVEGNFVGASDAIVASRLSYFLDLRGPALVINTGCSSSAVALHQACEALRYGQCDMALAGGAFAVMGQDILIGLAQTDMLTHSGRCRSFDAEADGMVMSEAVGMVALKPLDTALRDGDPIHGIIRASGMNQDGASNGITAPSGTAQADLIRDVHARFGIDPSQISYFETHGTGTKLGDPVEANALVKAFKAHDLPRQSCAIGSSKSHVGHSAAAAGVTGLMAVLMSMKHQTLPGLRHFETLNPLIDFEGSPFFPLAEQTEWSGADDRPLMAALNSFGHSGTNAHLVIEAAPRASAPNPATDAETLIVLSAKDLEGLNALASELGAALDKAPALTLRDIAHTLRVGRAALETRAAFITADVQDLREKLRALSISQAPETLSWCAFNTVPAKWTKQTGPRPQAPASDANLDSLAKAFVSGAVIDWDRYDSCPEGLRCHLPGYPFARNSYWRNDAPLAAPRRPSPKTCRFSLSDPILRDHVVSGRPTLPGVAYIDQALTALGHDRGCTLENLVWPVPVVATETVDLDIALPNSTDGNLQIMSSAPETKVHFQARVTRSDATTAKVDLEAIRARLSSYEIRPEALYDRFESAGIRHGVTLRSVKALWAQSDDALAMLEKAGTQDASAADPCILDAAWQMTMAMSMVTASTPGDAQPLLPFSMEHCVYHRPLAGRRFWVWARKRMQGALALVDIDVMDEAGEAFMSMKGLHSRPRATRMSDRLAVRVDDPFLKEHSGIVPVAMMLDHLTSGAPLPVALTQLVWPQFCRPNGDTALDEIVQGEQILLQGDAADGTRAVFCQANRDQTSITRPAPLNLQELSQPLSDTLSRDQCHAILQGTHGPSLMRITSLAQNGDHALATIAAPAERRTVPLINNAILAGVIWVQQHRTSPDLPMPFGLDRFVLHRREDAPEHALAYARKAKAQSTLTNGVVLDIDLVDGDGHLIASLQGLILKWPATDNAELTLSTPTWTQKPLDHPKSVLEHQVTIAVAGMPMDHVQTIVPKATVFELPTTFEEACATLLSVVQNAPNQPLILLIDAASPLCGLTGFMRSLRLEHPASHAQAILVQGTQAEAQMRHWLVDAVTSPGADVVTSYDEHGVRRIADMTPVETPTETPTAPSVFEPGDVVWVTGGLGGIGQSVARHYAVERGIRVVVTGRSTLRSRDWDFIEDIESNGGKITHMQGDVTDSLHTERLVKDILSQEGQLDGVIHAAGVLEDCYLKTMSAEALHRVLAPKTLGTRALDLATQDIPLKAFVLCSSVAGNLGNAGQAAYSAANAYQDSYANWRRAEERLGRRTGLSLSIAWPLWQDGGMKMGAAQEALMRTGTGMQPMPTDEGLRALDLALGTERANVMVAYGDAKELRDKLFSFRYPTSDGPAPVNTPAKAPPVPKTLAHRLKSLVSKVQHIPEHKVQMEKDLSDYGFDSISFTELANALNTEFGLTIMPTLFFEIPDLASLADHLTTHHNVAATVAATEVETPMPTAPIAPITRETAAPLCEIAVVGMAAKLPGAPDVDALWDTIDAMADVISEVPSTRWDWRAHLDENDPALQAAKWGGFVADADCFDHAFFGISPAEAEVLDPQLRLTLETAWSALENAAIAPTSLSGSKTGVFAGVATRDYADLLAEARAQEQLSSAAEPFSFLIANRLSYFLNLRGPSETIDTACSSSLIAIHRAIESLRMGTCTLALAGGVHVMASPRITLASAKAGMLSPTGRCMTFDDRANGYVRSEGAAMLVLKPLDTAQRDGDRILGVIRASGENHGGRASAPTAPNAAAQAELITDVHRSSGIDPRALGYIEAHGTGTVLGDPVEINGLKAAFEGLGVLSDDVEIPIGSLKTNIGHTEAAAGASAVIKVLQMFKHGRIPGNPHLKTPNPYLALDDAPFSLATISRDWPRVIDKTGHAVPRAAAVSSFGVGGSNAHLVLTEHLGDAPMATLDDREAVLLLSAKTASALRQSASNLASFLRRNASNLRLRDVAHTLSVGRAVMEHRLACVARDLPDACDLLDAMGSGQTVPRLHVGEVADRPDDPHATRTTDQAQAAEWIAHGQTDKALAAWVRGMDLDWATLGHDASARRVALPTYPFARTRHWVDLRPKLPPVAQPAATATVSFAVEQWVATAREPVTTKLGDRRPALILGTDPSAAVPGHETVIAKDLGKITQQIQENGAGADILFCLRPASGHVLPDLPQILEVIQACVSAPVAPHSLRFVGLAEDPERYAVLDATIALARSLGKVMPNTFVVSSFGGDLPWEDLLHQSVLDTLADAGKSVRYRMGERQVLSQTALDLRGSVSCPVRKDGVYWVLGGTGELGRATCKYLASRGARTLFVSSRRTMDKSAKDELGQLTCEIHDLQASVTDVASLKAAYQTLLQKQGRLDGVFHLAGQSGAAPIENATLDGFEATLSAKHTGTVALLDLLREQDLDFLCCYSSSSAVYGDMGSLDYAFANRFQSALAQEYPRLCAIEWPLWQVSTLPDADAHQLYLATSRQSGISDRDAMTALDGILASGQSRVLVETSMRRPDAEASKPVATQPQPSNDTSGDLTWRLRCAAGQLLKMAPKDIALDKNLADLGFESITLNEFAKLLTAELGQTVPPSVFFSHATLRKLSRHFEETGIVATRAATIMPTGIDVDRRSVAIIGMSGRFPMARDVDEMWDILAQGKNAVTEIDPDRFDWRQIYEPGKSVSKWCGQIPGLAEFDPLFFEISPLEAERMDPRQRHLLQEAWHALEDAALGPEQLKTQRIGSFVGVEEGSDYQRRVDQISLTGAHNGVLASRLAYFLDFNGPAQAINTACSSGLVAAHMACQALRLNECDIALAAGVNLMVAPEAYVGMSQAGMLSPDGKCHAFDKRANGMVPGEAVAVLVLKPLHKALADGDPIHGVIKASGTNYDGRTNGITAPSGAAQTALLTDLFEDAKVAAQDVDWVVSHGTGTELGDMVEAHALQDVFRGYVPQQNTAVTSTKSNFGHTFAASGLVSVIAMLQAMRAEQIPPSLHCAEPNGHVDWQNGPIFLNSSVKAWPRHKERARIGSVSAFGISGTNAAMVISDGPETQVPPAETDDPQLIALSAKTKESLIAMAARLKAHLRSQAATDQSFAEISKTLLTGRHPFAHRLAFVAKNKDDASKQLARFADGLGVAHHGICDAEPTENLHPIQTQQRGDLTALAEAFCKGTNLDWTTLWPSGTRRVSLPGTIFAKERCWIDARHPAVETPEPHTEPSASHDPTGGLHLVTKALEHTNGHALTNVIWGAGFDPADQLHVRDLGRVGFAFCRDETLKEAAWLGSPSELLRDQPETVRLPRLRAGMRPMPKLDGVEDFFGNRTGFMGTVAVGQTGLSGILDSLWHAVSQHIHLEHHQSASPASLGYVALLNDLPHSVTFAGSLRSDGTDEFADYDISLYDEQGRTIAVLNDLSCAVGFACDDIDLDEVTH